MQAGVNFAFGVLTAFDTFDGSSVVDPVIVSGTFWGSLATKIVSVMIGQLIATLVFTLVFSVAASQLSGVLDRVSKGLVERILGPPPPKLRTPPPDYTGSSSSSSSSSSGSSTATSQIDLPKLALCLAIDVLGTSSEFLPIVGEFTDLVYAPVAATLLRSLYGSNVVFVLEFTEEILPFTDVIPLATICWVVDTLAPASGLARLMQLGDYRQGGLGKAASDDIVIDTATATSTSRILESEKNRDNGSFR